MNIKTLVRRLTAATLLPVLLGLPMPSLAASQSPQQALTSALKNEMTRTTGSMQMAGRLGFEYAPMKRGEPVGKGSVAFSMSARALSATNGEGRLSIDSAEASGIPDMPEGVTIESPLSIQWKMVDGTFYVQLEKAPDSLLAMSKDQMGMDLGLILGRWIKFDTGANTSTDFFKLLSSGDLARGLRIKNFFDRNSILQVTRVEKRTKNAAGEDIWRMRVRVNPAVVNFFYREALRNLPKSGKARTDALKSLNASFVKIRVSLARTSMAVNVNVTKKLIERFEVGGKYPGATRWKRCRHRRSCARWSRSHRAHRIRKNHRKRPRPERPRSRSPSAPRCHRMRANRSSLRRRPLRRRKLPNSSIQERRRRSEICN